MFTHSSLMFCLLMLTPITCVSSISLLSFMPSSLCYLHLYLVDQVYFEGTVNPCILCCFTFPRSDYLDDFNLYLIIYYTFVLAELSPPFLVYLSLCSSVVLCQIKQVLLSVFLVFLACIILSGFWNLHCYCYKILDFDIRPVPSSGSSVPCGQAQSYQ